jgi:hypothetical protein
MHSPLIPAICLGAALAASAAAQNCDFIADYRRAEAAYARKDFAAAAAEFRRLAEQGLGPAQLRLGQLLADGQGVPADPIGAYRWLVLAADIAAPGAQEALAAFAPRLSAAQRERANIAPATWQPAKLGACLSGDPNIKRPNGTAGYDFKLVVNRLVETPSATGPPERRRNWLAHNLEVVRTNSPRYLIYFKSLYGIRFVGGTAPFVTTTTLDDHPAIDLNETYADVITAERLTQLIGAAAVAVHTSLSFHPVATATASYQGRTIRYPASDGGRRFLVVVKQAIDMVDRLPPDLAALARSAADLRYEPRRAFDDRGGAITLGEYRHDGATGQGYMSYSNMFETQGSAHVAVSLVDGGIYLRRDGALAAAKRQLADARKRGAATDIAAAEQRVNKLEAVHRRASGLDPAERGDCELEDYEIKTMEALKLDPIEINRKYKRRFRLGCS